MIGEKKLRVLLLVCGCLVVVLGLAALGLAFLFGYLPPADRAAQVVHLRDAQQIDEEGFLVLVNETHPLPDDYEPEDLVGRTLVAITNLPPRKMMGIDSCGMIISAVHKEGDEERLNVLMLDDAMPAGAKLC